MMTKNRPARAGKVKATARRLRVLIVDDSDLQLQFEQMLLAREDFDCLMARNGAEAIASARAHRPDLILLDIEMPVMNGLDAVLQIRDDARTAGIPIIMVTSRSSAEYMEKAFIGGCNDYVLKPIHAAELLAKIRAVTGFDSRTATS
ncbi:MAG: response regulator [Pseudomonadota bacterium]